MVAHRLSYWKTIVVAGAAASLVLATTWLLSALTPAPYSIVVVLAGTVLALLPACAVAGGFIVLKRDRDIEAGRADLFAVANSSRAEQAPVQGQIKYGPWLPRVWRLLTRHDRLIVGDVVRVKSLAEIRRTLDENGCLDRLPFMAEMARFCNRTATVYRSVDKIYDYGRTKKLKRMRDAVLLTGLRCDGSEHDGCQAECYLIWKTAWLTYPAETPDVSPHSQSAIDDYSPSPEERATCAPSSCGVRTSDGAMSRQYVCQFTELHAATAAMSDRDFRQDLRPLLDGNVSISAFLIAILTRVFVWAQSLRGGVGFPAMPAGGLKRTPAVKHGLTRGDAARVCSREAIAVTLDATGRNKGLWFDQEMLKHCGGAYTVAKRVERIIDDASGHMLSMKSPCIVLEGVYASGEFLRFCPQYEPIFWREAWLVPVDRAVDRGGQKVAAR